MPSPSSPDLSFSKTLNPSILSHHPKLLLSRKLPSNLLPRFPLLLPKRLIPICSLNLSASSPSPLRHPLLTSTSAHRLHPPPPSAGRSKKPSTGGRIEGSAELRREVKRNARRRSAKLAESLFYRLKNPHKNMPDNFSEDELQMIGLGYDRMVRFMKKDDPNLKHPYDWYKYGEFGPYSWRGIVVGDPIRGRFSDERVSFMGEVKDQEEWEKIEQHEMDVDFGNRLRKMNSEVGLRYFWVFVRHPRWRVSDLPWEQWTLVSEVAVEAGPLQRLDKWNLMGRLGNKTRASITQCAAWMRPDIIYVKRPVFQCRFEPQDGFFREIIPFLDPETENNYLFELKNDEGKIEFCTYFGGLCKIVKISPKAYVDDVVKAYEKLSDRKKSKCLEFLLTNHPVQLLHPYTKEWKAKLEEMELGCDAPDDEDEGVGVVRNRESGEKEFTEWIEDDDGNNVDSSDDTEDDDDDDEQDDLVMESKGDDDELEEEEDDEEEDLDPEEDEKYWDEEFKNAVSSSEAMENLVKKSIETSTKFYKKQLREMEKVGNTGSNIEDDGDETALRGKRAKVSPEEWKQIGLGPWRKRVKKSRIPPELFLRAAVRPFTYTNLVKEIVLTRHAILDGEIGQA